MVFRQKDQGYGDREGNRDGSPHRFRLAHRRRLAIRRFDRAAGLRPDVGLRSPWLSWNEKS
jgi:hypothetical protein